MEICDRNIYLILMYIWMLNSLKRNVHIKEQKRFCDYEFYLFVINWKI